MSKAGGVALLMTGITLGGAAALHFITNGNVKLEDLTLPDIGAALAICAKTPMIYFGLKGMAGPN